MNLIYLCGHGYEKTEKHNALEKALSNLDLLSIFVQRSYCEACYRDVAAAAAYMQQKRVEHQTERGLHCVYRNKQERTSCHHLSAEGSHYCKSHILLRCNQGLDRHETFPKCVVEGCTLEPEGGDALFCETHRKDSQLPLIVRRPSYIFAFLKEKKESSILADELIVGLGIH